MNIEIMILQLPKALRSSLPQEVCEAVNTLTLETFGAAEEELILEDEPGLLDAIFDLMDRLNPAVGQVRALVFGLGIKVCLVIWLLLLLLLLLLAC